MQILGISCFYYDSAAWEIGTLTELTMLVI